MPGVRPVTLPAVPTVAWLLLALHVPPDIPSARVTAVPAQIAALPVIVPAVAVVLIVTASVAVAVPQLFVTVYTTVSTPVDDGVSTPAELIAASLFVTLHVPPVVPSV